MNCRFRVGFFVVRECGHDGALPCSRCGVPVCEFHRNKDASLTTSQDGITKTLRAVCSKCEAPRTQERDRPDRSDSGSSSGSSSTPTLGSGGTFSGAGASGGWGGVNSSNISQTSAQLGAVPVGTVPTMAGVVAAQGDTPQAEGFSQADTAVFNLISEFDEKGSDTTSYDS